MTYLTGLPVTKVEVTPATGEPDGILIDGHEVYENDTVHLTVARRWVTVTASTPSPAWMRGWSVPTDDYDLLQVVRDNITPFGGGAGEICRCTPSR